MRLETVKSFLLAVLIGISLLLSFTLWSYRPDVENFSEDVVEDSTALRGKEQNLHDLANPETIIFKDNNQYFGFSNPEDSRSLYEEIQTWEMQDLRERESNGPPSQDNQIELTFPDALPMQLAKDLFTLNEDSRLPEWEFDRIYITFKDDSNSLDIIFLSEDGEKQERAAINNPENYDLLQSKLSSSDDLIRYERVKEAKNSFFIPADTVKMAPRRYAVNKIDPVDMVDIMFKNPDIVTRSKVSENEIFFTDSTRGIMSVYPNRRTMEFQDPIQASFEQMDTKALIDKSTTQINDHRGWTDDYRLIEANNNTVRYRLYYDNYPVFGSFGKTIIKQKYGEEELKQYNRPLYSLGNFLSKDKLKVLRSGSEVIKQLKNSETYDLENVEDITIGYHLGYDSSTDVIKLEPDWFMSRNGNNWQRIAFKDTSS